MGQKDLREKLLELMDFLAVFTSDERYKDIKPELVKMEKEGLLGCVM